MAFEIKVNGVLRYKGRLCVFLKQIGCGKDFEKRSCFQIYGLSWFDGDTTLELKVSQMVHQQYNNSSTEPSFAIQRWFAQISSQQHYQWFITSMIGHYPSHQMSYNFPQFQLVRTVWAETHCGLDDPSLSPSLHSSLIQFLPSGNGYFNGPLMYRWSVSKPIASCFHLNF